MGSSSWLLSENSDERSTRGDLTKQYFKTSSFCYFTYSITCSIVIEMVTTDDMLDFTHKMSTNLKLYMCDNRHCLSVAKKFLYKTRGENFGWKNTIENLRSRARQ
jgi:hypothetical protein